MHQFIEDAIKGGWNPKPNYYMVRAVYERNVLFSGGEGDTERHQIEQIILDPKAWNAVGITRGWEQMQVDDDTHELLGNAEYPIKMHTFLDHLIDGLSIEEALNKI